MPNTNHETGVAYGVISLQALDPDLSQELWYTHGRDVDYDEGWAEALQMARADWIAEHGDDDGFDPDRVEQAFNDRYQNPEPTIEGRYEGVNYVIMHLGGAPLLYVALSPHTVDDAPQCSPCAPNAGDLDSYHRGLRGATRCYDVPADWLARREI